MAEGIKRKRKHAESKQTKKATSFLTKVYEILEEPAFAKIIAWNEKGAGFIVKDVNEFTEKVLPNYFKHKNFASFVRQLNMYDFHKTKGDNCFSHSLFCRGMKHRIKDIKRKVGSAEGEDKVKQNGTQELITTLNELSQRLVKLEEKEQSYEKLLLDYKDIKERNRQLEQVLTCFSKSLASDTRHQLKESLSVDSKRSLNSNYQSAYSAQNIRNFLNDSLHQFSKLQGAKAPMSKLHEQPKMLEGPEKYVEEEKIETTEKRFCELEPDSDMFAQYLSPKLSDISPVVPVESTPIALSLSPLIPPLERAMEQEPNYLKEIEMSPPRYESISERVADINSPLNILEDQLSSDK